MSEFILKMDKWDRVANSYIYPRTPNKSSWRRTGLVPENDYTAVLICHSYSHSEKEPKR